MRKLKKIHVSSCPASKKNETFRIQVDCYAGYRGEETPRMIRMGRRVIRVDEVIDCWLSPDHRYFKIRGDDKAIYIIRHDPQHMHWQLTFYHLDSHPDFNLSMA